MRIIALTNLRGETFYINADNIIGIYPCKEIIQKEGDPYQLKSKIEMRDNVVYYFEQKIDEIMRKITCK